jgi:hypothetical protein
MIMQEAYVLIDRAIVLLREAKEAMGRNDKARFVAVTITLLEQALAYLYFWTIYPEDPTKGA